MSADTPILTRNGSRISICKVGELYDRRWAKGRDCTEQEHSRLLDVWNGFDWERILRCDQIHRSHGTYQTHRTHCRLPGACIAFPHGEFEQPRVTSPAITRGTWLASRMTICGELRTVTALLFRTVPTELRRMVESFLPCEYDV